MFFCNTVFAQLSAPQTVFDKGTTPNFYAVYGTDAGNVNNQGTGSLNAGNVNNQGTTALDAGNVNNQGTGSIDAGNVNNQGTDSLDVGYFNNQGTGSIDAGNVNNQAIQIPQAGTVGDSTTKYGQDAGSIGTQTSFGQVNLGTCPAISYSSLKNMVAYFICLINKFLVPILATLALVLFVWGIVQYVVNADNEEAREQGKKVILWGIIGLFSMVGVWGLVNLLISTLGFN